jgi:hypothetical protein
MKEKRINIRRRILFARFDKIFNMTASDIRNFRDSKDAEGVSQTPDEARMSGAGVMSGLEASKIMEKIITKSAPYRHQYKNLPDLTDKEWEVMGKAIRYVSMARKNEGDFVGDDGELLPKAKALKIWGRDEIKSKTFPNKDSVKKEVQDFTNKEREEQKKKAEKLTESFFNRLLEL